MYTVTGNELQKLKSEVRTRVLREEDYSHGISPDDPTYVGGCDEIQIITFSAYQGTINSFVESIKVEFDFSYDLFPMTLTYLTPQKDEHLLDSSDDFYNFVNLDTQIKSTNDGFIIAFDKDELMIALILEGNNSNTYLVRNLFGNNMKLLDVLGNNFVILDETTNQEMIAPFEVKSNFSGIEPDISIILK